ncbi:MAG: aspartyl protease family protein [Rikenellaceae bacterium]
MNRDFSYPIGYGLTKTGLPLIPIMIGDYALCFIIDTGATLSLLDSSVADRLGDLAVKDDKSSFVLSIDGKHRQAEKTVTLSFKIDEHSFTHTFVCESLFDALIKIEMESDIQVHGILGNDFLLSHKWIIDYERLEIRFK